MDKTLNLAPEQPLQSSRLASPIDVYLERLYDRLASDTSGRIADYIPELGRADPKDFGIAIATIDGKVYSVGRASKGFTIQSVSKPFMYGYALREHPKDYVLAHVGVEPTGEAFNSIILDDVHNRPFNPMVNSGAIVVAELMKGGTRKERLDNMLELFGQFAGHPLEVDEAVFGSEHATGHRNRAIAYMMLNTGMIRRDPEEVLELYFKQCSIKVNCNDLAVMAATLANNGINPLTREPVIDAEHVRDVLTLMNSCGMYNYAGQWAYEVGVPAKSGVSGGIIAVIPGQLGIGVYSPLLDPHGNSIRGVRVCQDISKQFGLHVFNSHTAVPSVIRREYTGDTVNSKRMRAPREWSVLKQEGGRIAVIELQGALFFGSVERLIRRVATLSDQHDFIVVDFKRVHVADAAASRLVQHLVEAVGSLDCQVALTHLALDGPLGEMRKQVEAAAKSADAFLFEDTDTALERFEDAILAAAFEWHDRSKFALPQLDLFKGLNKAEYKLLEQIVQPFRFGQGETIIREGDQARLLFVIAKGSVSVSLPLPGERSKRVACVGPGLSFGEMALFDGGLRSANVVADEPVICYGVSVDRLRELAADHPNILITILGNLARDFSERLRRANQEIRALE